MDPLNTYAANGFGSKTASAGTAIARLIPPGHGSTRTRVDRLVYSAGATAHTAVVLRPLADPSRLTAAAAAAQAVVSLSALPAAGTNVLAANDHVCVELGDGTFFHTTVSSVSGLAVTLAAGLPRAAKSGGRLWMFGLPVDVNPDDGEAHPGFLCPADASTVHEGPNGLVATYGGPHPLLVYSANATDAGALLSVTYRHTER